MPGPSFPNLRPTAPRRHRAGLAAALAALLWLATFGAQPARAAAPKVEDSIAQRVQACTGCHGVQGRAAPDGYYPRIAGKPAGYLYHQLLNFRDGRRHYALMTQLLDPLGDAYLLEIATHFSQLDVPYPAPLPAAAADSQAIERGRVLVLHGDPARRIPACVQCHGAAMMGVAPDIPGLLGLPRDYLNAQLGAWRNDTRRAQAPDCMGDIARRLDPPDIAALSRWLSSQPVPVPSKPATSLPEPLPMACGGVALPHRPDTERGPR
jgi:cytochrome c553